MTDDQDPMGLPGYYEYYGFPAKMLATPEGGVMTWRYVPDTGGWRMANDVMDDILFDVGSGNVSVRTRDQFIQDVERERAYTVRGDGPIFALYRTIDAILAKEEYTTVDKALVAGMRRRTYAMFEAELVRRGDPGADREAAREAGLLDDEAS